MHIGNLPMSEELFLIDADVDVDAAADGQPGAAQQPEWHIPEVGFEFQPLEVAVPRAHQNEKLGACGIDPAVFGDSVDPSFFIGLGIQAGIRNGISAEGNVNMLQQFGAAAAGATRRSANGYRGGGRG